jgi:ACS family glucarate transporter-like MFS transporter
LNTPTPDELRRTNVRYGVIALIFVISCINYADRATFSIAGSGAGKELGLSPEAIGIILSAFGWAYAGAQIPGGALLDRFGTKRIYALAIALWSLFTFLQGFVGFIAGLSAVGMLVALRFLVGLAEAPSFPGNSRIVAAWFPGSERGTASAIFNSSQYFAVVAFAPIMGWIAHDFGWRAVFWFMGSLGVIAAFVFWQFLRDPSKHPGVNAAERAHIEAGGGVTGLDQPAKKGDDFKWENLRQLLSSRMLVGIYLAQYCINVLTYFFLTWFPLYLVQERGMNIKQAGLWAAMPALFGFAGGLLGGVVSDWLLRRTGNLDIARKTPLTIGMVMATAIIACAFVEETWAVMLLMTIAFFGKGVASLGWPVIADVAPRQLIGLTGGVFNMFGNLAGIVTPMAVGFIVGATGSYDGALFFVGAHCALTVFAYLVIVGPLKRVELK